MLTITYGIYRIPKYGNRTDENEDAVGVYQSRAKYPKYQEIRCVIADGATQASFSSLWANLLVNEAVRYVPSEKRLWDVIGRAQALWAEEISKKILPWHAEEKVKKGAFSTLLWLSIKRHIDSPDRGGTWKAIAIGDSNLFIVRDGRIHHSEPIKESHEFGNSPVLLSSTHSRNGQIRDHITYVEWNWLAGDQFLLATDALAQYLLVQCEIGDSPWNELAQIAREKDSSLAFETWVQQLRLANKMRNDDTTLVSIRLEDQAPLIGD